MLTRQHILYEIIAPLLPIIQVQLADDHAHILEEVQRLGGYEEYVAGLKKQEADLEGRAEVTMEDLLHCVSVLQLFVSGGSPSQPLLEALRPGMLFLSLLVPFSLSLSVSLSVSLCVSLCLSLSLYLPFLSS